MNALEFNRAMTILPEPDTEGKQPPYWQYWRHELWQLGQEQSPVNFTHWPCIYHCMLVRHWPHAIDYEYEQLTADDSTRWLPAIEMPAVGDDYYKDTSYSQNLIHQAYHILIWERTTGKRIERQKSIVEFGGGYGAMALLCYRLGFNGDYQIYDLPEFKLLQQWFLSQCGYEVLWPKNIEQQNVDLIIALYSLSECTLPERGAFLGTIKAKSYLLLYSGTWQDYDNLAYFKSVEFLTRQWESIELGHLPDAGNYYKIGW